MRSASLRLVRAGEAEQLVLDLVERALGAGDLEQGPCVAVDACVAHELAPVLAPTRWMKPSMSRWWRGVVERLVDDALDGDAATWRAISERSSSVERPAAAAMSASALASSSAISRFEAGATVGEQRLGLCVGLGEQARALGLDVALGLADVGRLGVGRRPSPPAESSSSLLDAGGAIGERSS